jgi:hypothetical protein
MPGEALPLEAVVDRSPDVPECRDRGAVADGTQDETNEGPEEDEAREERHRPGQREFPCSDGILKPGDGVPEELGESELDADVDQQQGDRQSHPARTATEKGEDRPERPGRAGNIRGGRWGLWRHQDVVQSRGLHGRRRPNLSSTPIPASGSHATAEGTPSSPARRGLPDGPDQGYRPGHLSTPRCGLGAS